MRIRSLLLIAAVGLFGCVEVASAQGWYGTRTETQAQSEDVKPGVESPGVLDCPLPLGGNVLQTSHSGIYRSLGVDGTEFDLSIQGFDLYVTVREVTGQWFEGSVNLTGGDQRLLMGLYTTDQDPQNDLPARYLTLCTGNTIGSPCHGLNAGISDIDGPNTTPAITPFVNWRRHNDFICVKRLE